jgi:streptogramin lyase
MSTYHKATCFFLRVLTLTITLIFLPSFANSEETYKFERMWPTLQQPWYLSPSALAVDDKNNVYVGDSYLLRVQKFSPDGKLITQWNVAEGAPNQDIRDIAVDSNGFVYIADGGTNNRILKYTSDGQYLKEWETWNTGSTTSSFIRSIAIDQEGNIYTSDYRRVQKFTSDGEFLSEWRWYELEGYESDKYLYIDDNNKLYFTDYVCQCVKRYDDQLNLETTWGGEGSGPGLFLDIEYITGSQDGYIYVGDRRKSYMQKFDKDGNFIEQLDSQKYGRVNNLKGIKVDGNGNIYIADASKYDTEVDRIIKLNPSGDLMAEWKSGGSKLGMFINPEGIMIDNQDRVWIADTGKGRVQIFTKEGQFIDAWGVWSSSISNEPIGMVLDKQGFVHVLIYDDHNVQKRTVDGQLVSTYTYDDGGITFLESIAIDSQGDIYIGEKWDEEILKFDDNGNYLSHFIIMDQNLDPLEDGQIYKPDGLYFDSQDNLYVAETFNDRVEKFDSSGNFLLNWGTSGSGPGEFDWPKSITVDSEDNVYVEDGVRVQKFSSGGDFITEFGSLGTNPGTFSGLRGVAVASDGKVYVLDGANDRVQVFKKVEIIDNSKAIVVAGGGPYPGNNLWDATQMSANFAYRALTYQGFTKGSIYYLTSDTDLDLDGNGVLDDVDGDATNANLQEAITNWAADADSLVLYIVDHGGNGAFRMSVTETLDAVDLDGWLDQLQATITGDVTVIYDACESGSFLTEITPESGTTRIVITSTSPGESAYFVTQGSVSFSNYFWTHIFNGVDIKDAFLLAKDAIGYTTEYQHPLLDANGNGTGNEPVDYSLAENQYIGNGTVIQGDAPVIGSVFSPANISGTTTFMLTASGVTDSDGIARVWAVIRPPDYNQGSSDNPVQELPSVDLMPAGGDEYEGTYDGFNIAGSYQIAIYARDRVGNTSIPQLTTVTVENPLTRKAIIVVGGDQSDDLWTAIEKSAELVYESLIFQGYTNLDIYFLSNVTFSAGVDASATWSNLNFAINTWAGQNSQDLVLYMVGNGSYQTFELNNSENLSATELDTWLDNLQDGISGKVVVIYDASLSGSFLPYLTPTEGKERILISSSSAIQSAYFLSDGDISFSRFFWRRVLNGTNVRDAFINAKNSMWYASHDQTAQLDDNSNGIGNEKPDGVLARAYTIGVGILLAGDDPVIGSVCSGQTVYTTSATLWAENVTTTGTIDRVWAVISPPGHFIGTLGQAVTDLPEVELTDNGSGHYAGTYSGLNNYGRYEVAIYAKDTDENVSLPEETWIFCGDGPDIFEDDDTLTDANAIILNNEEPQRHNFHDSGDQDWVKFYGVAGQSYEIKTDNLDSNCDTEIWLFNESGTTVTPKRDDNGYGQGELLSWQCPPNSDGMYYVMVKQYNALDYGQNTGYDLEVYRPSAPIFGFLAGSVYCSGSGGPIEGAILTTDGGGSAISLSGGSYLMVHSPGTFTITAEATGYHTGIFPGVLISEGVITSRDLGLGFVDTDSDDLPDIWEKQYPGWLDWQVPDAFEDPDGDSLNNLGEYENGTNPTIWDTDDDGMPDGWEVDNTLEPDDGTGDNGANGDPDQDGWTSLEEYQRGTDPNDPSSHPIKAMPWILLLLLED